MWFMKTTDDIKFDFSPMEEHLSALIKVNGGRWTISGKFVLDKTKDGKLRVWVAETETLCLRDYY